MLSHTRSVFLIAKAKILTLDVVWWHKFNDIQNASFCVCVEQCIPFLCPKTISIYTTQKHLHGKWTCVEYIVPHKNNKKEHFVSW